MNQDGKSDYEIVADFLIEKYIKTITGNDDKDTMIGTDPKDIVIVGMLQGKNDEQKFAEEKIYSVSKDVKNVPSISIMFNVNESNNNEKIKLQIKGNFYYPILPTYKEEIEYLLDKYSRKLNKKLNTVTDLMEQINKEKDNIDFIVPKEKIVIKNKRIKLEDIIKPIELNLSEIISKEEEINRIINEKIVNVVDENCTDAIFLKRGEMTLEEIVDEYAYNQYIKENSTQIIPKWRVKIRTKKNNISGLSEYRISLLNDTKKLRTLGEENFDSTLYNAGIDIIGENFEFEDISLDGFVHDYDDDISVKAIVENASLKYDEKQNKISTINVPVYIQNKLKTIDKYNKYITFEKLINNPIENLKIILEEMKENYKNKEEVYKEEFEKKDRNPKYYQKYQEELNSYKREIIRFEQGIKLIADRQMVQKAFKYMNETFSMQLNQGKKPYTGWRLFQIIFIVSQLNDIVYSEYKNLETYTNSNIDNVDLLYFQTGGGKTEAFLGCTVFAMFFDRLRKKNEGVTAIIKYPLRLLSVQQLDRALEVITKANIIRKKYLEEDTNEFSVGYFVGGFNTANKIDQKLKDEMLRLDQVSFDKKFRVIEQCPKCGKKEVHTYFDDKEWKLIHKCANSECGYKIPVYVIDDEIYRYLPTVIISTIDKLANIGTSPKFKNLFGQAKSKCVIHGLSNKEKCEYCESRERITKNYFKDPVPTLFIQDELHLVRESLGTFASHYETFLQYYTEKLLQGDYQKKIKYIGATATISKYENHILNLYGKNARCFPAAIKGENFYSYIDKNEINRYILGFATYGKFPIEGMRYANIILRKIIFDMQENMEMVLKDLNKKGFRGEQENLKQILNNYIISIIYNNSKNDSNELGATFENQGNNTLEELNIPKFIIGKITGDDDFNKIKETLFDIQAEPDKTKTYNLILATSSISHGVDEESFNQIYFYGMPNNTAEYIQAYSRAGRKYPGFVFDIIRIIRERDRSYLRNFEMVHKYKDKLIEPVPINRWAKNAIYSTFPGIFQALLIQYYGNECYMAKNVKRYIENGTIKLEDLKYHINYSYGCINDKAETRLYKDIIDNEIENIYYGILNENNGELMTREVIAKNTKLHHEPMTSLRDIDEKIGVKLN